MIAPIVLTADGIRGSWASTSASANHHQLASARASTNDSRSMSPKTVMMAKAANASSARLMTEPHVTRRSLVSGCSSAPSVLAEPRADVVELDLAVVQRGADQRRHRRLLEVRQHGDDHVVAERPGDGDAAILAEQQDRQREHLGPILRRVVGLAGHRGRRQVAEGERPRRP